MAMDQEGSMYYFTSRTMKQFMFYGKYYHSKDAKAIHDFTLYGTAGYFLSYDTHFAFTKHMNKNLEDQSVCLPNLSVKKENSGISRIVPDSSISGLVYLLPKDGEGILMFSLDSKA